MMPPSIAKQHALSIASEHASSNAAQQCHGRTDGRTDADLLTVRVNLTDRIAHRGAAGFGRVRVRLMPHAASRGGQLANNIDYARRTDLGKPNHQENQ